MVRGVNRQIIEVRELENDYFERALLFIKPVYCDAERHALEQEARRALRRMEPPGKYRVHRGRRWMTVRLIFSALAGAGAAVLIFWWSGVL